MSHGDGNIDWERIIRDMIARSTESAPTEPGLYRMPTTLPDRDLLRI